jgi:outer membrane protein, heavy metal efflux system
MSFNASAVVLALFSVAAYPQELRLKDLVSEVLQRNPEILAAQKSYEAARQRPTQESSLPDPMISLGYVSVGNPLPGAGLGSQVLSNIGVMYSQELPYPGKLKTRGGIASKEAEAAFQQYEAVQLGVISRLITVCSTLTSHRTCSSAIATCSTNS